MMNEVRSCYHEYITLKKFESIYQNSVTETFGGPVLIDVELQGTPDSEITFFGWREMTRQILQQKLCVRNLE